MADARPLLERLLSTPDLAKIVPQLQPQVLHRVIERCGLEDSAELVALATPEQIARVLDVDVWRVRTPGADEAFDADRFGLWVAVLMESGAEVAAEKLRGLDIDLVVTGFSRHAVVYDAAAVSSYTTLDGQFVPGRSLSGPSAAIGGYVIEARRLAAWEAIVELLEFLSAEHPAYFHRVMRRCVRLSNRGREPDGFHNLLEDGEQDLFDLATSRDARREQQGYVAPAQARAFLRDARALGLDADPPPRSPIAVAYFRALESTETTGGEGTNQSQVATPSDNSEGGAAESDAQAIAGVVEILRDAGVLASPPRALLGAGEGQASRLSFVEAYGTEHPASTDDLAYLANVVMSGCSIQARPFTPQEASDAALAICNLGLENWPSHWPAGDLVAAFQVGWRLLYRAVCMDAAEHLIKVLAEIKCTDRDIQLRLDGLRHELVRHTRGGEPWRVRNDLDVILTLDVVAWAGLLGLIDECPVMHAALRASRRALSISPTDFEFISQNSHITIVHEFLAALPSILSS